jgi:hypothetical protein
VSSRLSIDDLTICDDLLDYYKKSDRKRKGTTFIPSGEIIVDTNFKDSVDVPIYPDDHNEAFGRYIVELQKAVDNYIDVYPECNSASPWQITETVAVQYYPPGGGYKTYHCERCVSDYPQATRHLVWMTYLNDVTDAGETEFYFQKIKIQPKKGLTIVWPADWTHTHRGIPSQTEEKYIITGWFNFV